MTASAEQLLSPTGESPSAPHLRADRLARRFGRRILFRDLSLTVEAGQPVVVTGANGSGKSTLLRVLAGLLRPSAGRVDLNADGRAVSRTERPLHTGLVAPYLNVYEGFSARENLAFLAEARRLPEGGPRIDEMLARVGLPAEAFDRRVRDYSSGMKQRVKYAAVLLFAPPLLLLDEPAANLDEAGLAMVDDVTEEWRAAGRLLVVATNSPETAARYEERLCVEDFTA